MTDTNPIHVEIVQLSALWCRLVSLDHHKDRDCHWYILVDYAYGNTPTFRAQHYGYVWAEWEGEERATYAEALDDLLAGIKAAICTQQEWADRQLANPDEFCHDEARAVLKEIGDFNDNVQRV